MKNFVKSLTLTLLMTGSGAYAMEVKSPVVGINARDANGETALYRKINELERATDSATLLGVVEGVKSLLDEKASTEIPSTQYKGQTALFCAVAQNKIVQDKPHSAHAWSILILEHLLGAGAKIDATEWQCHRTPMHTAAEGATLAAVKMLVKKLKEIGNLDLLFQKDSYGRMPLKFSLEAATRGVERGAVIRYLNEVMLDVLDGDTSSIDKE